MVSTDTLSIDKIRVFPRVTASCDSTGKEVPFDPTKEIKTWSSLGYVDPDPLIDGYVVLPFIKLVNGVPTPYKKPVLIAEAIACNPVPLNYMWMTGQKLPPVAEVPYDASKISTGCQLGFDIMGNLALVHTPTVEIDTSVEDHNAIMEILAYVRSH